MERISIQRRFFSKNVLLGTGVIATSNVLSIPDAHAIWPFLRLVVPFLGRNTAKNLVRKEVTKQVARATSKQALKRAGMTAAGGVGLAGTVGTAAMAYDIYYLSQVFSNETQEDMAEYQYLEEAGQTDLPLEMVWNVFDQNSFDFAGKNMSNEIVSDTLMLGIFDTRKQEYITSLPLGKINLLPQEEYVYQGFPISGLDKYFSSGDIITLDTYLKHEENMSKVQSFGTGAILLES